MLTNAVKEPLPDETHSIDDQASWEPSARFLGYAIATLVAGSLAFGAVVLVLTPHQPARLVGPVLAGLVALLAWTLIRRRRTRAAVVVMTIGACLVATGASVFYGGVRTPIMVAYPVIVVMVGWLIGPRAALVTGALALASVVGLLVADTAGLLPAAPHTPPIMYAVIQLLAIALATALVVLLVRSYHNRLKELRRIGRDLSARTVELGASKAELQRAQAVAQVGSWVYDSANDAMTLSAETCRIFGLPAGTRGTREAYLARTHEADRDALLAAWNAALAGGRFDHEHRIRVGDEIRWVRLQAELESGPDGVARHAVGVAQDVTERKRSEATVLATRNQLQATLDAIPDLLFEVSVDGRIHEAHTHRSELLMVPPENLLGRLFADILPQEATRVCQLALREATESGWSTGRQYVLPLPQGDRWFELSVSRMPVAGESDLRFIVIARDITERKAAEEKLQLSSSVFTHSREGIMITAHDGTIMEVNDAFTRITGYGHDEVLGQNPRLLNSGRHDDAFYTNLWHSLHDKGHWYGEVWNRRKNGEVYAEMQTISAVRDGQGQIRHFVSLFSDISAIKAHQKQLEHIAHYDALTELPNRVLLADRLQQSMAQSQRRGLRLAVVFLDLDGFKSINDQHGHETGDNFLIGVANRMKQAMRDGDTLARIGGDEFVAVLIDLPDVGASVALLGRLLAAVAQPVNTDGELLQVSASLGVTYYPQEQAVDAEQLLRQADHAMYQAKLAGKNRYHVFDAEEDSSTRGRHADLARFRQGMADSEFVLHYQPQVNMRSGAIVGAEALIRWDHPQRGLLPPASFLPLIGDHVLDIEIGEWVISSALKQIETWRADGLDLPVSVNVGAQQLQQVDFVERLRVLLAAHPRVEPSMLQLEVLETSALEDVARVSEVIAACRQLGVLFALDDFGTGYSSLTYLKRLPVALLKIDRSFVRDMLEDPDDLAILEGVIGLAAAFHRQVIAEGVETLEHGEVLLQLGCEMAQGFGIAHPMPAHELPGWARAWRTNPVWANLPKVDRRDLGLLFASVEQRAWLAALKAFLLGDSESPPQIDPQRSRLGAWLAGKRRGRDGQPEPLAAIEVLLRDMHALAARLCERGARGHHPQVAAGLAELHTLHEAILADLRSLTDVGQALVANPA